MLAVFHLPIVILRFFGAHVTHAISCWAENILLAHFICVCIVTIYCCLYDWKPHSVLDRLKERFHRVLDVIYGLHVCDCTLCNYVFNTEIDFFCLFMYSPSLSFRRMVCFYMNRYFYFTANVSFHEHFLFIAIFFLSYGQCYIAATEIPLFYKFSYLNSNYRMNVRDNYFMTVQKVWIFLWLRQQKTNQLPSLGNFFAVFLWKKHQTLA